MTMVSLLMPVLPPDVSKRQSQLWHPFHRGHLHEPFWTKLHGTQHAQQGGIAPGPRPPAAEGALSSAVVARATGWLVAESVRAVEAGVAGAASVRICSVAKRLSFLGVVVWMRRAVGVPAELPP